MNEEQKWAEFRQLVQEMRDAMTVDFGIKRRHEDRIKEHEEWLRQMAVAEARHSELIQQHEAMMVRIDEKLERIADLILRGRSTNGNQT
jgi:hypothetical protein